MSATHNVLLNVDVLFKIADLHSHLLATFGLPLNALTGFVFTVLGDIL